MLRTRLFLSLLPFVIILLAMGVGAVALFSRMAAGVDLAVAGHYQSILSAQAMSQALAGMDREMQFAAVTRSTDNKLFNEYQNKFEEYLALQRTRPMSVGILSLNEELATNYNAFIKIVGSLGVLRAPKDLEQEQVFASSIAHMNALLERMRDQNYRAVLATSDGIQEMTRNVTRMMIVGMIIVLAISIYTCYQLSRSILQPIQLLTRATRELGEGHSAEPVPVVSNDEVGELAKSFNKMLAQLAEYRRSTSDEIMRLHRTMVATLASFPDPIFVLDEEGHIGLRNPAAEELAATLRLNGELPERLATIAHRALDTGQNYLPHSFDEAVTFRVRGAEKSFLPRVLAMRTKENALCGVAVVLYDVTRFRLLDSAKSNLVATVSHELNTPLTSLRMALHLLLEESVGALTSKQGELLEAAREDTERLLRILNDLLDLARLEEGDEGLHRERVLPGELIRTVIKETADKISARGLKMNCAIEPNLPMVSADRQRIGHVFNNLIANAIKYSPENGEILLSVARIEDDYVEFCITDQGPGIPEEFHARIFDRFFRAPGQTKTGAGLGLSIAREITAAHGGRISVRSHPGKGSTFCVALKTA
jgi:signal transduction histidine kinase